MDVDNANFLDFVAVADTQKLEYILIGGMALLLNGVVRFTQDADIWLEPTNENRDRFVQTLLAFGYDEDDISGIRIADFTQPQIAKIHDIPMDVLTRVHHRFDYNDCKQRAKATVLRGGYTVYFLHINDLRETKVLARRTKDLNDVILIDELLASQKEHGESETDNQ